MRQPECCTVQCPNRRALHGSWFLFRARYRSAGGDETTNRSCLHHPRQDRRHSPTLSWPQELSNLLHFYRWDQCRHGSCGDTGAQQEKTASTQMATLCAGRDRLEAENRLPTLPIPLRHRDVLSYPGGGCGSRQLHAIRHSVFSCWVLRCYWSISGPDCVGTSLAFLVEDPIGSTQFGSSSKRSFPCSDGPLRFSMTPSCLFQCRHHL